MNALDLSASGAVPKAGPLASTREQLVVAAEYLFAVHGVHGVSLQDVRAAAGQSNRSAVQYHFGTKQGLIRAVLEYRLPRIAKRRAGLLREAERTGRMGDARTLVEALVVPLAEEPEFGESSYASFLQQLGYSGWSGLYRDLPDELKEPAYRCSRNLREAMVSVPEALRGYRMSTAFTVLPALIADREHAIRSGLSEMLLPFPLFISELTDLICNILLAPPSEGTSAMLHAVPEQVRANFDLVFDAVVGPLAARSWTAAEGLEAPAPKRRPSGSKRGTRQHQAAKPRPTQGPADGGPDAGA